MTNSNAPAPVRRTLAALARTAALATTFALAAATLASAQQPAAPAKPKPPAAAAKKPAAPAPAAPAPAAQAPGAAQAGGDQQAQGEMKLIYSKWVKFCVKDDQQDNKQVCFTGSDARLEGGMPISNVVILEPEGGPKIIRISVPIAVQLLQGSRLVIDQGKEDGQAIQAPFSFCGPQVPLCFAQVELTPERLALLKKSQMITIQAFPMTSAQATSITLPTGAEFVKAYEGPPTDQAKFAEEQRKLQEELQRRAEDARKKLEQQGGTAGAPQAGK